MKITVPLLKADVTNRNGRVYTEEAIEKMIEDFNEKRGMHGVFLGQLGFPENIDVTLSEVSHDVEKIYLEEKTLFGDIKILETPKGDLLKGLIEMGGIVFRPRSAGNVDSSGEVQNVNLISVDAISSSEDVYNISDLLGWEIVKRREDK